MGDKMPPDTYPRLMISQIARMLDVHPQTLRLYERHGLLTPTRTGGNTRLYSGRDLQRLQTILHLTRTLGVNLAGVEIILSMQCKIEALQRDIDTLRQELQERSTAADPGRALIRAVSRTLVKALR